MYSKNKGITDRDYVITPPPGYDGSRFRRRSDGRDDAFPMYSDIPKRIQKQKHTPPCDEPDDLCQKEKLCPDEYEEEPPYQCNDPCEDCPCEPPQQEKEGEKESGILSFLQGIGREELLLIALIVLLSKDNMAGIETILILALLLCIT